MRSQKGNFRGNAFSSIATILLCRKLGKTELWRSFRFLVHAAYFSICSRIQIHLDMKHTPAVRCVDAAQKVERAGTMPWAPILTHGRRNMAVYGEFLVPYALPEMYWTLWRISFTPWALTDQLERSFPKIYRTVLEHFLDKRTIFLESWFMDVTYYARSVNKSVILTPHMRNVSSRTFDSTASSPRELANGSSQLTVHYATGALTTDQTIYFNSYLHSFYYTQNLRAIRQTFAPVPHCNSLFSHHQNNTAPRGTFWRFCWKPTRCCLPLTLCQPSQVSTCKRDTRIRSLVKVALLSKTSNGFGKTRRTPAFSQIENWELPQKLPSNPIFANCWSRFVLVRIQICITHLLLAFRK